ncbi:MAG TPA: hypothetical protein VGY66_33380 [Gemmataceae bacterium]|jgi:hypothetical protein|nr:hypothetical protein [Gemmataceae bacterium]
MRVKRLFLLILPMLALAVGLGCQQDEIRSYDVATSVKPLTYVVPAGWKESPAPQPPRFAAFQIGDEIKIKERMLAALIPGGEQMWFLKLQGPEAAVSARKNDFESVLHSFHFTKNPAEPVAWTTPGGWKQEPGNDMRYATLRLEDGDNLEMTITHLSPSPVLDNINRWRGQLSLPKIKEEADLPKVTTLVKVDGVDATTVDFTGTSSGKKMPPFAGGMAPFAHQGDTAKSTALEVVVTKFAGDVGGREANVIRWRGQVGLGEISSEQLGKDIQEREVGGDKAYYVDLTGPESQGGAPRVRMLGVGVPHAGETWFFKMTGPADLVGKHKEAFEAFLQSVKFAGGKGANP